MDSVMAGQNINGGRWVAGAESSLKHPLLLDLELLIERSGCLKALRIWSPFARSTWWSRVSRSFFLYSTILKLCQRHTWQLSRARSISFIFCSSSTIGKDTIPDPRHVENRRMFEFLLLIAPLKLRG